MLGAILPPCPKFSIEVINFPQFVIYLQSCIVFYRLGKHRISVPVTNQPYRYQIKNFSTQWELSPGPVQKKENTPGYLVTLKLNKNLLLMLKQENEYSRQLKKMDTEDLVKMLNAHEKYVDGMLQALVWELGVRGVHAPLMVTIQEQINRRNAEESAMQLPMPDSETVSESDGIQPLPSLYSQTAILGFTLFFSPITGGILLSINLARLHKKGIVPVLIFAVIYSVFQGYVSMRLEPGSVIPILLNVAGGIILSEFIWNNFIGKGTKYERRSIIIPLLIVLAIFAPLAWIIYQNPELLNFKPQ